MSSRLPGLRLEYATVEEKPSAEASPVELMTEPPKDEGGA